MALKEALVRHIQENIAEDPIDENTMLIESGIIDSMGLMQIIMFIEEQTGIRVPDDEVMPENFQTVGAIDELVKRLAAKR